MVAIGRGLMAKPSLLMMDEPSLGLAPLIVAELFRIISEINHHGLSILLVEQNARRALFFGEPCLCHGKRAVSPVKVPAGNF